jgi:predicted ATPase
VFCVGLSSLTDPSLVLPTVAQTLGARGPLSEHIAAREILLVLDNLEHVVDTAPELAALVAVCPRLRLLVTSRERLRVDGESVYAVPQLASSDAAELFCARSGLEPNDTISELCRQLDHLPLAVELAAARASVMSPAQILERLSNRLDLLKGSRHSNSRQRTLRAAITWSFELLHPDEQELFVRLAVFAGGWNLDAAEAVLGADVDVLQSLVDKSLLDFGDERFRMLETIRQFAAEKFQRDESRDIARRAHVEFFLAFAEEAQEGLEGAQQTQWFARLSADQDNVRAALACSVELGLAEATIRLAAALWRFWYVRGAAQEGRRWYEIAFGAAPAVSPALRANAVYGWGCMDYAAGAYDAAQRRFEHALELYRETGNDDGVVRTLYELGSTHSEQGDVDRAENLYQQALALARATGNRRGEAVALGNLGYIALHRGDLARAAAMHQETLLLDRERGDDYAVAISLAHLAWIDIRLGRLDDAAARITDSLRLSRAIEDNLATASTFVLMSRLLLARGDASASARILGAGTAFSEAVGVGMESEIHRLRDETVQQARAELGDEAFGAAFDAGRSLTPEQAVALVANAESARA